MRISILSFFCVLLLLECKTYKAPTNSFIHKVVDTLKIDRSKNILIYTINPNDCISCMNGFKTMNAGFSKISNSLVYIILIERTIEKNEWLKKIKNLDLKNGPNKIVLWDKVIFNGINSSVNKKGPLSIVCIYNYQKDSVIYASPIKDVVDEAIFKQHLDK